jgi:release factor glutamine methyltransferase
VLASAVKLDGEMMRGTHDHQAIRQRQPYVVELEGLSLVVSKDVFPPDVGTVSMHMSRILSRYQPQSALDMGCGTGFLALAMRRQGFKDVWALDIHPLAVACCRLNLERNPRCKPVEVRQSDLFASVPPGKMFDLITFHQPYFPSTEDQWIAATADGGRAVIFRFLGEVRAHLSANGVIVMAFQNTAGSENDPKPIAEGLGHDVNILIRENVGEISKFVYEIQYDFAGTCGARAEGVHP